MKSIILLAALAPVHVQHPSASPAQTLALAKPYIDRANEDWSHAIVTGDAALLSAPYDDDGIFISNDGSVKVGKSAVRAMYETRPAGVKVLEASIKSDGRVAVDADDVYEWGTARMLVERNGRVEHASGSYLTVWHRKSKNWAITRNIAF